IRLGATCVDLVWGLNIKKDFDQARVMQPTKTLFETIGHRLGQKAAQAKNAFDLMGGSEEDSLRAEIRLGRDLAAALLERIPLVEENETTRFVTQIGRWL